MFAPDCCGWHPTSLSITSGGCMGKILGANPAPEQMQAARSWKCVSAAKAALEAVL